MSSTKFVRSNILITLLSLVSVGVNFISQMVLAYYFGAKAERDAYFSATTVPVYLVALFVGSLSVIFLPFFVEFRKKNPEHEVIKFVSSTIGICISFLVGVTLLSLLFSNQIVLWVAPGFENEQLDLTISLFRILIFTVLFQSLTSLFTIFHHVDSRFLWPAVSPIITPIVSLVGVLAFHNYGIVSLAVGVLIGSSISMLMLIPIALKNIRIEYLKNVFNPNASKVIRLALPLLVSGAIFRLTTIIERMIASKLPPGSVSYLGYTSQIYVLLASIASSSIATTFFPIMSAAWSEKNQIEFNRLLSRGIKLILLITFPIAAILLVLGNPIIEILFQRGAFDYVAKQAVASCLSLVMGAFIFGSVGNVLVKVFYITNNTVTISIICIIEVIVYAISGYLLASYYSYLGLALTVTISTGFTILVSSIFLIRWKYLSLSDLSSDVIKLFIAAIVCGITAYLTFGLVDALHVIIATGISGLMGLVFYLVMILYVLKINDSAAINKAIKSYF
jgi:putative peptidoglycan lipid II flippase